VAAETSLRRVKTGIVLVVLLILTACQPGADETTVDTGESAVGETTVDTSESAVGETTTTTAEGAQDPVVFVDAVPEIAEELGLANIAGNATRWAMEEGMGTLVLQDVANLAGHGCDEVDPSALVGNLAESWTINEDQTEITFKLRETYSEYGNRLTSEDVRYSVQYYLENVPSTAFHIENTQKLAEPYVTVLDDETFILHVRPGGFSSLTLSTFRRYAYGILDSTVIAEHATEDDPFANEWLKTHTANFGPWKMTEFTPGERVVYERNEGYNGAPRGNVDTYIVQAIPEASTRVALVARGEVDLARFLSLEQYQELEQREAGSVLECVSADRDELLLNWADPVLSDLRVREAISMAIDREALVNGAAGYGSPAQWGFHASHINNLPDDLRAGLKQYTFDPDQARALLVEAGYPDGFDLEIIVSPARPGAHAESEGVLIAQNLVDVGINATINVVDGAEQATRFGEVNYSAVIYQEQPSVADPYFAAFAYIHSDGAGNPFYASDTADALTEDMRSGTPESIAAMSELVMTDYPVVYLIDATQLFAFSDSIEGYNHRAFEVRVSELTKN
jgi:peptide/nickel transport system substrate-binding protein